MSTTTVAPLDPDSPQGRQVADDMSQVLAEIRLAIAERERATVATSADTEERAA